jgi:hypothetical protein
MAAFWARADERRLKVSGWRKFRQLRARPAVNGESLLQVLRPPATKGVPGAGTPRHFDA